MWRLFRKQCRMSMWCLRQRQCGKVLTQTTFTHSQSNLYNYTATCTSTHAHTRHNMLHNATHRQILTRQAHQLSYRQTVRSFCLWNDFLYLLRDEVPKWESDKSFNKSEIWTHQGLAQDNSNFCGQLSSLSEF